MMPHQEARASHDAMLKERMTKNIVVGNGIVKIQDITMAIRHLRPELEQVE